MNYTNLIMTNNNRNIIPLSVPNLSGKELDYVAECVKSGWISSAGKFVNLFEDKICQYVDSKFAVATMNGTSALHISLLINGVKPGDYVIVSNLTFVASVNAIRYVGAEPILIDADLNKWQMDLDLLEKFLLEKTVLDKSGERVLKSDNRRIKLVMPVHVQGNIFDFVRFIKICDYFSVNFIEDAAEALGSKYKNQHAGTFGNVGVFSFNGNKIISSGGGGVIITNDEKLANRAKHLTTTAKTNPMTYYHDEVGYNYRMVNVLAAIGLAQLEKVEQMVNKKKYISKFYIKNLNGVGDIKFQQVDKIVDHNCWLFTIWTKHQDNLLKYLISKDIICRPFWMPMNQLPMYKKSIYVNEKDNSAEIHQNCMTIPCSTNITEEQLNYVIKNIKAFYDKI